MPSRELASRLEGCTPLSHQASALLGTTPALVKKILDEADKRAHRQRRKPEQQAAPLSTAQELTGTHPVDKKRQINSIFGNLESCRY